MIELREKMDTLTETVEKTNTLLQKLYCLRECKLPCATSLVGLAVPVEQVRGVQSLNRHNFPPWAACGDQEEQAAESGTTSELRQRETLWRVCCY